MALMWRKNAPNGKCWASCYWNTKKTFGSAFIEFAMKITEMLVIWRPVVTGLSRSAAFLSTNTSQFSWVRLLKTWAKIFPKIWIPQSIRLKMRVRSLVRFRANYKANRHQMRPTVLLVVLMVQLINRRRMDLWHLKREIIWSYFPRKSKIKQIQ